MLSRVGRGLGTGCLVRLGLLMREGRRGRGLW